MLPSLTQFNSETVTCLLKVWQQDQTKTATLFFVERIRQIECHMIDRSSGISKPGWCPWHITLFKVCCNPRHKTKSIQSQKKQEPEEEQYSFILKAKNYPLIYLCASRRVAMHGLFLNVNPYLNCLLPYLLSFISWINFQTFNVTQLKKM